MPDVCLLLIHHPSPALICPTGNYISQGPLPTNYEVVSANGRDWKKPGVWEEEMRGEVGVFLPLMPSKVASLAVALSPPLLQLLPDIPHP